MSKQGLDDTDMPGYFLPEESQLRLSRLSDYIKLLARLAQPRVADGAREWSPEVRAGELAFCLELLSDQVDLVLDEVSWPALRVEKASASGREAAAETTTAAVSDAGADDCVFGLTPGQVDMLGHLVQAISVHGGVVAASHANPTLPALGKAILGAAAGVREVLDQVETQRLRDGVRVRSGVDEPRAAYVARRASSPVHGSSEHAGQPGGVRLH